MLISFAGSIRCIAIVVLLYIGLIFVEPYFWMRLIELWECWIRNSIHGIYLSHVGLVAGLAICIFIESFYSMP